MTQAVKSSCLHTILTFVMEYWTRLPPNNLKERVGHLRGFCILWDMKGASVKVFNGWNKHLKSKQSINLNHLMLSKHPRALNIHCLIESKTWFDWWTMIARVMFSKTITCCCIGCSWYGVFLTTCFSKVQSFESPPKNTQMAPLFCGWNWKAG